MLCKWGATKTKKRKWGQQKKYTRLNYCHIQTYSKDLNFQRLYLVEFEVIWLKITRLFIINQYYDKNTTITLNFVGNSVTRGNKYKLRQSHCKYDLRRHIFTNRIVAIWNSLPDYVVDADSVNVFKNSLDRHWCTQELFYDYESKLTRIGNRRFWLD